MPIEIKNYGKVVKAYPIILYNNSKALTSYILKYNDQTRIYSCYFPLALQCDVKLYPLQPSHDDIKSKDEIEYEKLTTYLKERNLELCFFYDALGDMELDCIHKADAKYPDYGLKHLEYTDKLMNQERKKLAKKYNLADSIFLNVSVFGMSYCKYADCINNFRLRYLTVKYSFYIHFLLTLSGHYHLPNLYRSNKWGYLVTYQNKIGRHIDKA